MPAENGKKSHIDCEQNDWYDICSLDTSSHICWDNCVNDSAPIVGIHPISMDLFDPMYNCIPELNWFCVAAKWQRRKKNINKLL